MRALCIMMGFLMLLSASAGAFSGKKRSEADENNGISDSSLEKSSKDESHTESGKKRVPWFHDFITTHSEEVLACKVDSDCVLVQSEIPCSCSSGGGQWAISKEFEERWLSLRKEKMKQFASQNMMCPMVYGCSPGAKCETGQCKTLKQGQGKPSEDSDETLIIRKKRKR